MTDDYIDLTPKCKCGCSQNLESTTHCKQCGAPYPPPGSKAGLAKARAMAGGGGPSTSPQKGTAGLGRRHLFVGPGTEHPLTVDELSTLGRSDDCTLKIPSQRVSRKHAQVSWRSGLPVLENVSTSNPTKVNGRSIQHHELRDGDEVEIGPYQMTYRSLRPGQSSSSPIEMGATMVQESEAMAGNLSQLNLFEILGTFEQQETSGTISISTTEEDGQIILGDGKFVKASFENMTGQDAVLAMLDLDEGLFSFTKGVKAAPMKIMRTFDYQATAAGGGGKRDLKRIKISQLLKQAKERQEREGRKRPKVERAAPAPTPAPTPEPAPARPPAGGPARRPTRGPARRPAGGPARRPTRGPARRPTRGPARGPARGRPPARTRGGPGRGRRPGPPTRRRGGPSQGGGAQPGRGY